MSTASHWLPALCVFGRSGHAVCAASKLLTLPINVAPQEARILIAACEVIHGDALFQSFLANTEIAFSPVAVDELRVLVNIVGLANQMPCGGRKIDDIIDLGAGITVFLRTNMHVGRG